MNGHLICYWMYFLPGGTGNSGRCRCELRCQGQTDKARSRSWSEELAPADQLEPASFGMRGRPPPHTHTHTRPRPPLQPFFFFVFSFLGIPRFSNVHAESLQDNQTTFRMLVLAPATTFQKTTTFFCPFTN